MYVSHRFELAQYTKDLIRDMEPDFGYDGFGEFIYYRTYSRSDNGYQENWADTVIRVIQGTMTIRKDWYIKNHISWNERFWQKYARKMAISMHKMEWMPPGRGLWANGTEFIYERGGMALYNCAALKIKDSFENDLAWLMDSLMLGVGVGFSPIRNDNLEFPAQSREYYDFEIPDSREGWVDSCRRKIYAIRTGTKQPRMIYDQIRGPGLPIRGFGGTSSGPAPLIELHEMIDELCQRYMDDAYYDSVMLKTDLANMKGVCTVAGNLRRSAELASLSINDPTFINLKDYEDERFAYRAAWGWMSNNSVTLSEDSDFEKLGEIAKRVIERGEPGYLNLQNFKYGRIGKKDKVKNDPATLINPCMNRQSWVLTPKGMARFGDIKVGDVIWSETEWTTVLKIWSTGINKVFKYRTTAGYFEGTEDHQIIEDGFKVQVKDADGIDILTGPYLYTRTPEPQSIIDGLLIGDGTVSNNEIYLYIGTNDQDYFKSEIRPLLHNGHSESKARVETNLKLEDIPWTYLRKIPERYLKASPNTVANFLRGLYSANGSICGGRVTLKAASFDIIEGAQLMLNSIGIRSYYTTNKSKVVEFSNGRYRCKQSYDLNITTDRRLFARTIGFIQEYKNKILTTIIEDLHQSKYSNKKEKVTYGIVSRELISEEETFDMTVDNVTHTYWTNGVNVSNCGEVNLCNREVCNVAETLPTRCDNHETWLKACEYATVYCSTVSLLPTHQPSTNRVVAKHRRIAVSIIDYTGWKESLGVNQTTKWMREGYKKIRQINRWVNGEAGVPESIRVTTIKPGGTTPKLAGRTSGIGHPTFDYTLRRVIVAKNSPLVPLLIEANIPYEDSVTDQYSLVFSWPIHQQGSKPAEKISLWEQAMNLVLIQREWSDNAVSNTLYFVPRWTLRKMFSSETELKTYLGNHMLDVDQFYAALARFNDENPDFEIGTWRVKSIFGDDGLIEAKVYEFNPAHEEDSIEPVLSAIAPLTKSVSLLPHTPQGVYAQMPESGLSKAQYEALKSQIKKVDWSRLSGSMGQDERYCQGAQCELPISIESTNL